MKITVLTQLGDVSYRGAGKRGLRHASILAGRYGYCELITCPGLKAPNISGLQVKRGPKKLGGVFRTRFFRPVTWVAYLVSSWHRLNKLLRTSKSDLCHFIPSSGITSALAMCGASRVGKKVVAEITLAGSDDPITLRGKMFGSFRSRTQCRADALICISPPLVEKCREAGVPAERIFLIPNDVNTTKFVPPTKEAKEAIRARYGFRKNETIFLYVGIISERKNVLFLVEAFCNIAKLVPEARLILAGPVNKNADNRKYVQKVKARLAASGIGRNVLLLGETEKVEEVMMASDAFVFASEREGFGTVLIEAMACGLPVIVKRIPGLTDYIVSNERDGLVVDTLDEFVQAGLRITQDLDFTRSVGKQARITAVSRFSEEVVMDQYETMYRFVVGETASASVPVGGESLPLETNRHDFA